MLHSLPIGEWYWVPFCEFECKTYLLPPIQYNLFITWSFFLKKKIQKKLCSINLHLHFVLFLTQRYCMFRDHSVHVPSQWETALHRNVVSHWLGACTEWFLQVLRFTFKVDKNINISLTLYHGCWGLGTPRGQQYLIKVMSHEHQCISN